MGIVGTCFHAFLATAALILYFGEEQTNVNRNGYFKDTLWKISRGTNNILSLINDIATTGSHKTEKKLPRSIALTIVILCSTEEFRAAECNFYTLTFLWRKNET